jgi:NAD(P)-dependent dehydrogenase (short-subunit alcohol dehydrogenase family)
MTARLHDKVAIVTGSGGAGLGRAGARLFAAEGAKVVVLDVRAEGINETLRQIKHEGGEAIGIKTDVRQPSDVEQMVQETLWNYGQIDILWNNAAILTKPFVPAEQLSLDDWNETLAVNLTGYFICAKSVVPHMKQRRSGAIVNTASLGAVTALAPGLLHYASAKAGVVQMTRVLAAELGPFNIRVNCLLGGGIRGPGGVWTEVFTPPDASPFGDLPATITPVMPTTEATRWPTPDEFAAGALYLVDPASGPVTGVILPVDGGWTSRSFP